MDSPAEEASRVTKGLFSLWSGNHLHNSLKD